MTRSRTCFEGSVSIGAGGRSGFTVTASCSAAGSEWNLYFPERRLFARNWILTGESTTSQSRIAQELSVMAGRPRSMARKVAAVEDKTYQLAAAFYALVPKMYIERAERQASGLSPLNIAWCEALSAMTRAYDAMEELRKLLEAKAQGLPEPDLCPHIPHPETHAGDT